jgi:hypothetical protein
MTNGKKKIPRGIDQFDELVRGGYYYVDKTPLVKHLLDSGSKVTLYARPRRFGKSLNLSMLDCFFNIDKHGIDLFQGTRILQAGAKYTAEMGKYPVVKISFKDMKCSSFGAAALNFRKIIQNAWGDHDYLEESPVLKPRQRRLAKDALDGKLTLDELPSSIKDLTELLHLHHKAPAVVLVDEYDVPLEAAYTGGYYDQAMELVRALMSSSCKDNPHLRLAVHTGCLRIARESIYTGFNNPSINTILSMDASDCFGFTDAEVQTMLAYYGIGEMMPKVREWYDGYRFGDAEIYNPWSLLQFTYAALANPASTQDAFAPYWMNTSGNDLLVELIRKSVSAGPDRNDIERLLDDGEITRTVNENVNYASLQTEPDALWNLLLFTGYVKPMERPSQLRNGNRVPLKLVNLEVKLILRQKVEVWYQQLYRSGRQAPLVAALQQGKPENAEAIFDRLLRMTVSYHDRHENFYHGYLLGLLSGAAAHECLSNRETGDGRADIQFMALDHSVATVIEVKVAADASPEAMQKAAEKALGQALRLDYAHELLLSGYQQVHVYGIACFAKRCRILMAQEKQ